MGRAHSFVITVSNNKTEKQGIDYLLENFTGYFFVNRETKKQILSLLDFPHTFLQAFDLIYIPRFEGKVISDQVIETHIDEIILIELKTTKKYLPENPKGFFFGATENEFKFGELLGDKFRFCFVCLHEVSRSHVMMTVEQLESRVRTKRIQFQINL